jgi:hypothetical protein
VPAFDRTSPLEAHRVDRVPAPKLSWTGCGDFAPDADCATVELPLDYDEPNGPKTTIAVLRVKATEPGNKIGTLFVNPGGPAGSGTRFAADARTFMRPEVLAKFDIVGFDPRGTQFSGNVRCWPSVADRDAVLAGFNVVFPRTAAETAAYIKAAKAFGRACSKAGTPLSGSMSTAEVARDLDVLRRAVGDERLTYFVLQFRRDWGPCRELPRPDHGAEDGPADRHRPEHGQDRDRDLPGGDHGTAVPADHHRGRGEHRRHPGAHRDLH